MVFVSCVYCEVLISKCEDGKKLVDFVDVVFDNGVLIGDVMVEIEGLEIFVFFGLLVGGCIVINVIKVVVV